MESGSQGVYPNMKCAVVQDYMSARTDVPRYQYFQDNHLVDSLYQMLASVVQMFGLRCIA
jgi:hypothetical protein